MANEIRTKDSTTAAATITLASLAAAAARQATILTNSNDAPSALVYVRLKSGAAAPAAGGLYEVYLLRGDADGSAPIRDDGAGATDAAITLENAPLLGTVVVTASANKTFYGVFDTAPLGLLGPQWGLAIRNATTQALSSTEGDHAVRYVYLVPEVQ